MSRARIFELAHWWGWRRIVGGAAVALVVALVVYFAVRVEPPPIEDTIPMSGSTVISPMPSSIAAFVLTVHVGGEVVHPGVYSLPAGSRVVDAVEAAGGVTSKAHTDAINLAAPLVDSEQVIVPRKGSRVTRKLERQTDGVATSGNALVNVNTASVSELDGLPGVGPATAKAIVDMRASKGQYGSAEDLLDVPGIGPAKLAQIRPLITW